MNKIYGRDELKAIVDRLRQEGKTVVFTNGCFDILHAGHTRYLRAARTLGDVLVLALNSDSSVRSLKGGKRPIVPAAERAEVLAALSSVDYVTVFDEPTPLELIEFLRPDVIVKGGDWAEKDIVGGDAVRSWGEGWPSCPRSRGPRRQTSSKRSCTSTGPERAAVGNPKFPFTWNRLFGI